MDPFAGGGAIPFESLRVGADAFASDLNPIAVILNKVLIEHIPRHGKKLADEVRKLGKWIKEEAEKELSNIYPRASENLTPLAYLWARTIHCEGPGCGAKVPLIRTNILFAKGAKRILMAPLVDKENRTIRFVIRDHGSSFHTIKSGSVTCPVCGYTTPNKSVMVQVSKQRGGAASAELLVVVSDSERSGRTYEIAKEGMCPNDEIVFKLHELSTAGVKPPTEKVNPNRPSPNARGLSAVTRYGMEEFRDLYTDRQKLLLLTIRELVAEAIERAEPELREAVGLCLILSLGRLIDRNSTLCRWISQTGAVGYTFGRQALSMIWDFVEINPLVHSGGWDGAYQDIATVIEGNSCVSMPGQAEQFNAAKHGLADDFVDAFITDPPYYDAIPYADLSDFFYVWLRPLISQINKSLGEDVITPKEEEAIWNPGRILKNGQPKDEAFYERQMQKAFAEGRRITRPTGIGVVVFAHKSTAGWEALLNGLMQSGWIVTASWPIDTEREARTNAIGTASLASSVHLVCRPRENPDGSLRYDEVGDWRDVLQELPERIHAWMPRLADEGVVGADAIFACLGPALEIFSRYSRVEKADGTPVPLRDYLEQVWSAVSKEALNMVFQGADATGFEEDARLTAMWLWTLVAGGNGGEDDVSKVERSTGYSMEYDAARKISQGLGAHMEDMQHLVEIKGDHARLLAVAERTKYLFGKDESQAPTGRGHKKPKQTDLFEELKEVEAESGWASPAHPRLGKLCSIVSTSP